MNVPPIHVSMGLVLMERTTTVVAVKRVTQALHVTRKSISVMTAHVYMDNVSQALTPTLVNATVVLLATIARQRWMNVNHHRVELMVTVWMKLMLTPAHVTMVTKANSVRKVCTPMMSKE